MAIVKSCLAIIGLITLLLIGSCVLGISSLSKAIDPQSVEGRIGKPVAEVRQAVYDYLDGATYGVGSRAKVDHMSDGTIQLNVGTAAPYAMTMTVAFEEDGPTATKVKATYNADRFAWSQPGKVMSTNLHRCLHADFERFMHAVDNGRYGGRLDLNDLIARSKKGDRTLRCELSGSAY
jgi:hypothetical protein